MRRVIISHINRLLLKISQFAYSRKPATVPNKVLSEKKKKNEKIDRNREDKRETNTEERERGKKGKRKLLISLASHTRSIDLSGAE